MDYKKLGIYALIILAALGYWYKTRLDADRRLVLYDRFATVYAGVAVVAELYRNEPAKFLLARDSVYRANRFGPDSLEIVTKLLQGREKEWDPVWELVRVKTDSLSKYFITHPVIHAPADSTGADSTRIRP